ncbi:uncharacterized protein LOC119725856 [Patiria miniata]|uniref:Uncharacterized protein n=1 Tax=Patiria miniata TaxID=46514 RepID=A0A913ZQM4_PATMI|nr:uncharacterized protein LOC119721437 [Patiria miniata]XP_038053376.1 uncharacterized protein LOC119725856 [Patiria miniata]
MCCYPDKYGRPSALCLVPLAFLCIMLGGGLVGTWVGCYYECIRGKEVEYNYYAAVWTGGLAVFSGVFQLFLVCFWNKCLKYFLVIYNVVLVLCCLLSAALYSYITYLENEAVPQGDPSPSVGVILSAVQAVLAVFILFFVMVWNCVIGCASLDDESDSYDDHRRATNRSRSHQRPRETSGPYEDDFFNREPGIYSAEQSQYQERPQEVSYGQPDRTNTSTGYIIPRASVRGAVKDDRQGYHSNGGTMVVDGREPRGFYSGSSRFSSAPTRQNGYIHQNGGAVPNANSMGRVRDAVGSRSGDLGSDRYGRGISLMQMHGVAPASSNITDGYY